MKAAFFKTVAICGVVCVLYIFREMSRHDSKSSIMKESEKDLHKEPDVVGTKPFLTVFTTFKEIGIIPHHQLSFNVVVTNWPSFKPYIRPVVFLNFTDSHMAKTARETGWEVLPMTRVNPSGTPFLRDMYKAVFDRYDSSLYGYANGDLIFDDGLVKTLIAVNSRLQSLENNVLLTGIRTNVDVDLSKPVSLEEFHADRLKALAKSRGQLFQNGAVDYFFLTKHGCSLRWPELLDVVIGRPAYGTYLVAMAARHGVNVIDTTATILSVHLSEKGVMSHGVQNPDGEYNRILIGNKFNHLEGYPKRAKLDTRFDENENVVVHLRQKKTKK